MHDYQRQLVAMRTQPSSRDSIMQTNSTSNKSIQPSQPVIPVRKFKVAGDNMGDFFLEFTILVKCDDAELHELNKFWSGHEERLKSNQGNIVQTALKLIAPLALASCRDGNDYITSGNKYGINTVFNQEGFNPSAFEITEIDYSENIDDDSFIVTPVMES